MSTTSTLVDFAGSYPLTMIMATFRALKAIGPSLLLQSFRAGLFCTKPFLPPQQIHRFGFHLITSNSMTDKALGIAFWE